MGENTDPHSRTSFVNMLYGPHFSILRSRPKTESSSYVMPISALGTLRQSSNLRSGRFTYLIPLNVRLGDGFKLGGGDGTDEAGEHS